MSIAQLLEPEQSGMITWSVQHQVIDPLAVLTVHRRWIRVVSRTRCQCVACGIINHGPPDDCHEAVVENTLVARDPVAGPHSQENLSMHQVILDLNLEVT